MGFDLLLLYNLFVTFAPVLFTGYNPKASLACKNWMQLLKKWLFSDVFRRQSWVMVMIMKSTEDFVRSMRSLIPHEAEAFFSALEEDAPVSIRLNPTKFRRNPLCFSPEMVAQTVPWSQWGYYLSERPSFTFDPLFHAGYYYVQEASSMFLEYVVRQLVHEPAMCLDLCAAPGGKSAILLSSLPEGSLVVSNEIVRQRACVLSENLIKLGQSMQRSAIMLLPILRHFPGFSIWYWWMRPVREKECFARAKMPWRNGRSRMSRCVLRGSETF